MTREDYDGAKRPTKEELAEWRTYFIQAAESDGEELAIKRLFHYIAALERVAETARNVCRLYDVFDHQAFKGRAFQELVAALDADAKVKS